MNKQPTPDRRRLLLAAGTAWLSLQARPAAAVSAPETLQQVILRWAAGKPVTEGRVRFEVQPLPEGLKHLALVRLQELDGFIEGLFGANDQIDLPERAHVALGVLAEIRAMLAGIVDVLDDDSKPAQPGELKSLLHNLQKMTLIVETEMNKAILSCKRARVQNMAQVPATRPTLH